MTTVTRYIQWIQLHIFISVLTTGCFSKKDDLVVHTTKGRVRGVRNFLSNMGKSVDTWLGIPFAKPPVQGLRFKHPMPMDRWHGTRNTTEYSNSCWQPIDDVFPGFRGAEMWNPDATKMGEDCLYLNVYVPRTYPRLRKAAVLVWIYGGGFYSGTTSLEIYDPRYMAVENDLIVVSINYRIGIFGFLGMGHPDAPGNAGMFDQLLALEWIRDNIRHFGGDPHNVTIFGESAGSVSVSLHLLSPLSRNKFSRAILESGVAIGDWCTVDMKESIRRSMDVAEVIGCEKTDDVRKIIQCLMETDAKTLSDSQWVTLGAMQFPWVPVIDGVFLTESPEKSLRRGNFKRCPILIGSNKNEGSYFLIYEAREYLKLKSETMNREQFKKTMDQSFYYYPQYPRTINKYGMDAVKFQYTDWSDPRDTYKNLRGIDQAIGDYHFICQINKFANIYARAGENVFYYHFTHRTKDHPWPKWMGVLHADEVNYVFGDPLKPHTNYTNNEKALSRKIMSYWVNFVRSG